MMIVEEGEARQIARQRLDILRTVPYDRLVTQFFHKPQHEAVTAPSGIRYDVSIESIWDDRDHQNLRVMVLVDDVSLSRRFRRVAGESFIMAPDGTFIGE